MTAAVIATIVGIIVSILVEVIPKFQDWWAAFFWKKASLFTGFVVVAVVWWALACFTPIEVGATGLSCDLNGAVKAVGLGLLGFMSNQATFAVAARNLPNAQKRD